MGIKKLASFYSIFMGICMIGMWTIFLSTGGVPELQTRPFEIILHITAEILTALSLILGGFGLLRDQRWGFQTYLFSMGMLVYTLIVSPGYYMQIGNFAFVGMFGTFFAIALAFIILTFTQREKFNSIK